MTNTEADLIGWHLEEFAEPLRLGVASPVLLAAPVVTDPEIYKMRLDVGASTLKNSALGVQSPSDAIVCVRFHTAKLAADHLSRFQTFFDQEQVRLAAASEIDSIFGPFHGNPSGPAPPAVQVSLSADQDDVLLVASEVGRSDELFACAARFLPTQTAPVLQRFATRLHHLVQEHRLV